MGAKSLEGKRGKNEDIVRVFEDEVRIGSFLILQT